VLLRIGVLMVLLGMQLAAAQEYDSAENHATDYAFLSLLTLTPDFSAANYKIEDSPTPLVRIGILRLPFILAALDLNDKIAMKFEMSIGYQKTQETVPVDAVSNDYVDSKWEGHGASLGLLFDYKLSDNIILEPKIRAGVVRLANTASYHGETAEFYRPLLDGTFFNWNTKARVVSLGLGLIYDWQIVGRDSTVQTHVFHLNMDSFDESNDVLKFNTNANMATLKADIIIPTSATLFGRRLDAVALGGSTVFLGENRRTLGFTTLYELGAGIEYPIKGDKFNFGHVRLSGLLLRGEHVRGWLMSLDYNPK
jgi:hypothetical protein